MNIQQTVSPITGRASLLVSIVTLALTAGCVTQTGPFAPQDTTKFTLENTDRFVLLDQPAQYSVTCTGLQERPLADGRLEVVANVKNRESRRIQVQINCVFKDDQGFSTGDETPWQTLILSENSTEAVRFTAMNTQARKYTVRVRQAR
ncbi:MAG: DUF1425 domain-containing protein [Opitutus sp.]|nr:DUF1425 domain-containing protein [Opitutus sp.]